MPAAPEPMQSPAWKPSDLLYSPSLLDRMKYDFQLGRKIGMNSANVARLIKTLETAMPKVADFHDSLYGITVRLSKKVEDGPFVFVNSRPSALCRLTSLI